MTESNAELAVTDEEQQHENDRREIQRYRDAGRHEEHFDMSLQEGRERYETFEKQLGAIGSKYEEVDDGDVMYVFIDQETAQRLLLKGTRQKVGAKVE